MRKLHPARLVLRPKYNTRLRLHSKHEACCSTPGSMSLIPLASQAPSGKCPSALAFVSPAQSLSYPIGPFLESNSCAMHYLAVTFCSHLAKARHQVLHSQLDFESVDPSNAKSSTTGILNMLHTSLCVKLGIKLGMSSGLVLQTSVRACAILC